MHSSYRHTEHRVDPDTRQLIALDTSLEGSWETRGKSLKLSVLLFLHLKNGGEITPRAIRINILTSKVLQYCRVQ